MMELRLVRFKMQLLISFVILLLVACSDSGTDSGPAQAETVYGLGECETANEGAVKLVTSENQYYKCVDGNWKKDLSSNLSSVKPCKTETEDNCEYGVMTDERDGQMYMTVKIGNQVWMAENLNYRYLGPTAELDSSSFCYDGNPANCDMYGRLYLWSAAMDSAGIIKGNTANNCGYDRKCGQGVGNTRGICPQGWHLPDDVDFGILLHVASSVATDSSSIMLRSTNSWDLGAGTDAFGFSALSSGVRFDNGKYGDLITGFWSSTEEGNFCDWECAVFLCLNCFGRVASIDWSALDKDDAASVRCLKD
jgi:uncharacterized protein (TIGR02145 family)